MSNPAKDIHMKRRAANAHKSEPLFVVHGYLSVLARAALPDRPCAAVGPCERLVLRLGRVQRAELAMPDVVGNVFVELRTVRASKSGVRIGLRFVVDITTPVGPPAAEDVEIMIGTRVVVVCRDVEFRFHSFEIRGVAE